MFVYFILFILCYSVYSESETRCLAETFGTFTGEQPISEEEEENTFCTKIKQKQRKPITEKINTIVKRTNTNELSQSTPRVPIPNPLHRKH